MEDQPLVRQRPRHMSSDSVELPKETQVIEASSPSNPQQHDSSDLPQHSGNVFPDEVSCLHIILIRKSTRTLIIVKCLIKYDMPINLFGLFIFIKL